jgi:hypothetical protein
MNKFDVDQTNESLLLNPKRKEGSGPKLELEAILKRNKNQFQVSTS